MIKAAVVGYGNIGDYVLETLRVTPDFEAVGLVRRNPKNSPAEIGDLPVVDAIEKIPVKPDVAILCTPTRAVPDFAKKCLEQGNQHG